MENAFCKTYNNRYIFIFHRNEFRRVAIEDIVMVEAARSYCSVYLSCGETILLTMPMARVYRDLQKAQFVRINRSYVVNMMHVKSIRGNCVVVDSHKPILMSVGVRNYIFSTFVFIGTKRELVSQIPDSDGEFGVWEDQFAEYE